MTQKPENGVGDNKGSPTLFQNYMDFGAQTAKNRAFIFICLL